MLLLLGDGLRLSGNRRRDNFLLRFLFFREAQVGLRYAGMVISHESPCARHAKRIRPLR